MSDTRYYPESNFYQNASYEESFWERRRTKFDPEKGENVWHRWIVAENEVRQPSGKIYLADMFNVSNAYYMVSGTGKYYTLPAIGDDPSNVVGTPTKVDVYRGRHGGKVNLLYFDGHVSPMSSDETYVVYRKQGSAQEKNGNPWNVCIRY